MSNSISLSAASIASGWFDKFDLACKNADVEGFSALFIDEGWLRDLLCFSWDFRTIEGKDLISSYLSEDLDGRMRLSNAGLHNLVIETASSLGPPSFCPNPLNPNTEAVQGSFTFCIKSPLAVGRGFFRLIQEPDGQWKAFTVLLNIEDLVGYEEPKERPLADYDGQMRTWAEAQLANITVVEADPTVLIVGAGHAGLTNAARLGRMGIRAIVIEKTARVGDVWRNRYPNLKLNTSANVSSILYHPWPKTYPQWITRDLFANFLEGYAKEQNICVWLSSTVLPIPTYDHGSGRWTVIVNRLGERITLRPKHIIMATGNGAPHIPDFEGVENFKGPVYHSSAHRGAEPFRGKRALVIGSCSSAADMCQDFLAKGASEVTMVQRHPTCVISSNTSHNSIFATLYPENRPIEDSDLMYHAMPPPLLMKLQAAGGIARTKAMDRDLLEGLEKIGFKMTWESRPGRGNVGLVGFIVDREGSGSLIDAGCCRALIDGKIKLKQASGVKEFVKDGVIFEDGSKVVADVVVAATGNRPMIDGILGLFGDSITEKTGHQLWGLDESGEIARTYRPTGQSGLWFVPGAIQHARFYSKHLALQILARELGIVQD